MASPFTIFRKHQKFFLACLALLAMIAFVFLSGPVFDSLTSGNVRNPVVVTTKTYGNLTEADLSHLITQQNMVLNFFERVYRTLGFTLPVTPPSEESVVETWILANRARELGIVISNDAINAYLRTMFGDRVPRDTLRQILREMRVSDRQLFEALRMELAARQMLEMIDFSVTPTTPAQRWDYYLRLNRRATIELVAEPVAKYIDRVGEPEESTLRDFFEKYKENYYDPTSPEPGFRRPHRVALEYTKADIAQFMEPASIPEEEIQQYYEKNKDTYYVRSKLPAVEKVLPKQSPPSGEKAESPPPKESAPGPKAEPSPKAESVPSDPPKKPESAPKPTPEQPTPEQPTPEQPTPEQSTPAKPTPEQQPGTPSKPPPEQKPETALKSSPESPKPEDKPEEKNKPTTPPPVEPTPKPTETPTEKAPEKTPEEKPAEAKPETEKPEVSKPTTSGTFFFPVQPEEISLFFGEPGMEVGFIPEGLEPPQVGIWTTSAESAEPASKEPTPKESTSTESTTKEPASKESASKESAPKESTSKESTSKAVSGTKDSASPEKPSEEKKEKSTPSGSEPPGSPQTGPKEPTSPPEQKPVESKPPAPVPEGPSVPSAGPATKPQGSEGPAASPASPPEGSKYIPLEEVQEEIRETLARGRAQAKIEKILYEIRDQMNSYSQAHLAAIARGQEPPPPISLQAIAKQHGLEYRKTELLSEWQFRRDHREIAQALVGARDSVVRYLFYQGRPPLQATLAQDVDAYYLFWKLEDAKEAIPSWDYSEAERLEKEAEKARSQGKEQEADALMKKAQWARKETDQLRQEVLRTWKMIQARSLARDRAAQLAALAQKSGKPLSEALANEPAITVLESGPFSWLTHGAVSPRLFLQTPPPRISAVPHVEMAGEEFMETVFRMEPGQVGVAFNQPQTVAYVIRLKAFEPSQEVLWKMFLAERYEDYSSAAIFDQHKIRSAWMEQIKRSIGFRWERQPHPAAAER